MGIYALDGQFYSYFLSIVLKRTIEGCLTLRSAEITPLRADHVNACDGHEFPICTIYLFSFSFSFYIYTTNLFFFPFSPPSPNYDVLIFDFIDVQVLYRPFISPPCASGWWFLNLSLFLFRSLTFGLVLISYSYYISRWDSLGRFFFSSVCGVCVCVWCCLFFSLIKSIILYHHDLFHMASSKHLKLK